MLPFLHPETTTVLGAPEDWDVERNGVCYGLPVVHQAPHFFSYWKTTWRERLTILFGRPIRLSIMGDAHPVVSLDTKEY